MMNDIKRLQGVVPILANPFNREFGFRTELPEITIGNGAKRVHYNGSFHANEWIYDPDYYDFLK